MTGPLIKVLGLPNAVWGQLWLSIQQVHPPCTIYKLGLIVQINSESSRNRVDLFTVGVWTCMSFIDAPYTLGLREHRRGHWTPGSRVPVGFGCEVDAENQTQIFHKSRKRWVISLTEITRESNCSIGDFFFCFVLVFNWVKRMKLMLVVETDGNWHRLLFSLPWPNTWQEAA